MTTAAGAVTQQHDSPECPARPMWLHLGPQRPRSEGAFFAHLNRGYQLGVHVLTTVGVLQTPMAQAQPLRRSRSLTLQQVADELRREFLAAHRLDGQLIERDIAARRHEAGGGRLWANQRERIQRELEKLGISESEWCREELDCDIRTMRRRVQLAKGWNEYERRRREEGSNGQFGLVYGLSLISVEQATRATSAHRLSSRSAPVVPSLDTSKCQFITGSALTVLAKLKTESVNCVVTSPPYWPIKCEYGAQGVGYEATPVEYIGNIVAALHETKRVLKDNGTLWIIVGDSYARPAKVLDATNSR